MKTEELITKITRTIQKEDGSEVRIVAQDMFGSGLHRSIDVNVYYRKNLKHNWTLCSDRPHPGWRNMPIDDYIKNGRSEMLQKVTPAEILKVTRLLGTPMSRQIT